MSFETTPEAYWRRHRSNGAPSFIADSNSTSTPLVADAVFTGTADDVSGFSSIRVFVATDKGSAVGGLSVEWSSNGTDWDYTETYTVVANETFVHSFPVFGRFFRVRYTNGSTTQGHMRLGTHYSVNAEVSREDESPLSDFLIEVSKGNVQNHSLINKFGRNPSVGTSFAPITVGGVYQTPQVGSATTLRVKAGGDANDTAAGSGARAIQLQGLDTSGEVVIEEIPTAGIAAGASSSAEFIRLFRAFVSESGTYATQSAGSHADDIVIEATGGGDWLTIDTTEFPRGQSEVGAYTIPSGYTGYLVHAEMFTDSSKITDVVFFRREGVLQTSAPYEAMRVVFTTQLTSGGDKWEPRGLVPIVGPADVGFMAKVASGTAQVSADFELLLVRTQ